MGVHGRLADLLAPPPPPPDIATPTGFAAAHSRGRWLPAPHLRLIEQACLHTIATGGRLIISASVRHGKTELVSRWLTAWYLGTHPHNRVILAGHEADFAASHGRAARDILTEHGHRFGITVNPRSDAANRWDLAHPHTGGMLTIGVGGSPIGRGADLAVIDDPLKSYEAAMSPLVRRRIKEWWAGTMESRIEPGGAAIIIMARWHEDDLAGWLLTEAPDQWDQIRLPAIADDLDDPMGRNVGEPLWPERFDLAELHRRRVATSLAVGESVWLAQYQQTPTTPTGGIFPGDRWQFAPAINVGWRDIRWVRGWDLAATAGAGDFTVGVLMGRRPDGTTVVADVTRGQWSSADVRHRITSTARTDPPGTRIELPQDPGQAGKDQAAQLAALLAGADVHTAPQTGSKEVRAVGWAAQQQAGNVVLLDVGWNGGFIAEHQGFPRGTHDDQVDAAATAFNALVGGVPVTAASSDGMGFTGR